MTHTLLKTDPRFTIEIEIAVPFYDADAMGIVWHGNYYRYLEVAREALLKQFDYGYRVMKASGYTWPIIDARLKYIKPLTFEQKIRVQANLTEFENRLRIDYQIFDIVTGQRTTVGHTIQVAVNDTTQEMCFVSPDILWEKIGISRP